MMKEGEIHSEEMTDIRLKPVMAELNNDVYTYCARCTYMRKYC